MKFLNNNIVFNNIEVYSDLSNAIKVIQSGKMYQVDVMDEVVQQNEGQHLKSVIDNDKISNLLGTTI